MEYRSLVKYLILVLIVLVQIHGHQCCFEEERKGLLDIKAFLNSLVDADVLPSWNEERESDCCVWERLKCDATTQHVMFLSLQTSLVFPSLYDEYWLLNVSLFPPFQELRGLDLSYNEFCGCIENEGFDKLSILRKLETLDLTDNKFNNSILPSLSALTSLKSLNLSWNRFDGLFPAQDFVTFNSLEILNLRGNAFVGSIPPSIWALSSLKVLSLAANMELNGSLPTHGLCQMKKLEMLELQHNKFQGILPWCLDNLTSLRVLDLSFNNFKGNISSSLISALRSLEYIDLSNNEFDGSFSFSSFANHTKLVAVHLSHNPEFEVETEISSWVPLFQLNELVLSDCKLNKLNGNIPKFLLNQHELRLVDLSNNNLKGRFPNWLLQNNTRLKSLNLRNNSFTGQFRLHIYPNTSSVEWIDVRDNQIGGQLQENIGEIFPYIEYLCLSRNSFEGGIPISLSNMSGLGALDLSFNNFSGEVPKQFVAGCIKLVVLRLSSNNFQGQIFSEHFNLTELKDIRLDDNQFTGTLSNVISKCSRILVLDIGNNNMSGQIHSGIGNFTELVAVNMRENSFEGLFPCELMPTHLLDLSHNSFSGSLPQCPNLEELQNIHLQGNKFIGSIPKPFFNISFLLVLDVRDNNLSGNISNLVGGLSELKILLLGGNHFSGLIPHQLCQLNKISLMDLSRNSFFGTIPHCFHNIAFWSMVPTSDYIATGFDFHPIEQSYKYENDLDNPYTFEQEVEGEFVTKYRLGAYEGDILNYMSGLDLSCNKLSGEIPHELGKLSYIHALNLSHNQLKGSIPTSFSNLTQIESLDLSYNKLSGKIPSELIDLNFLAVFTVAHNNLSGKVPDMKAQFATFTSSSYEGNLYLCGPPLEKNCTTTIHSPTSTSNESEEGKWYEIDRVAFFASFAASCIVFLLGVATILYVNPYWRQRWFNLIEEYFYSSYYFVCDSLHKIFP